MVNLKLLNINPHSFYPDATLNSKDIIFASDSPVEDVIFMQLQSGHKIIQNLRQDQFLMLDTIEQMFAITQHFDTIYTDRYHPGVIGYRFHKNVHLLDLPGSNHKLIGLHQLMLDYPDPKVIAQERVPIGFQKLRETLRKLRKLTH